MRERLCQPSPRPLTATEKYGELGRDKRFVAATMCLLLCEIYKIGL